VTRPSLPFCLGARDIALGLASPLAGRDDTVEAAADFVEKRLVAERSADQLAPPQRGEGWVVRVPCREDRERLHAHEPVVAAPGAPDATCLPGRTASRR
jgi:hypothetical protein